MKSLFQLFLRLHAVVRKKIPLSVNAANGYSKSRLLEESVGIEMVFAYTSVSELGIGTLNRNVREKIFQKFVKEFYFHEYMTHLVYFWKRAFKKEACTKYR